MVYGERACHKATEVAERNVEDELKTCIKKCANDLDLDWKKYGKGVCACVCACANAEYHTKDRTDFAVSNTPKLLVLQARARLRVESGATTC